MVIRGAIDESSSLQSVQIILQLLSTGQCIAHGGSNRRGAVVGLMAEIDGNGFQGPIASTGAMREIMAKIVKGDCMDEIPLGVLGLCSQVRPQVGNAAHGEVIREFALAQPRRTLTGEHIGTLRFTRFKVGCREGEIGVQSLAGLVMQIERPRFAPLEPTMVIVPAR